MIRMCWLYWFFVVFCLEDVKVHVSREWARLECRAERDRTAFQFISICLSVCVCVCERERERSRERERERYGLNQSRCLQSQTNSNIRKSVWHLQESTPPQILYPVAKCIDPETCKLKQVLHIYIYELISFNAHSQSFKYVFWKIIERSLKPEY